MRTLLLVLIVAGSAAGQAIERGVAASPSKRPREVVIGILIEGSAEETARRWGPLATYLDHRLGGEEYRFTIRPLSYEKIDSEVAQGRMDFVLTNPTDYVWLESGRYLTRILTVKSRDSVSDLDTSSSVILTRVDRPELAKVEDLRGRRFAAVDPKSFEGWQLAWRELNRHRIQPATDLKIENYGGAEGVLDAILDGSADAGTVSSVDFLMAPDRLRFRVLDPKPVTSEFPLARSTPFYPEWPLASLTHTPEKLSKKVAIALLEMPADGPIAGDLRIGGWAIPRSYHSVHEIMRELKLPPYQNLGRVTLSDAVREYQVWLYAAAATFLILLIATIWVVRLNLSHSRMGRTLQAEFAEREKAERALHDSEALYHSLVETLPQNIFRKGIDARFSFVNRRFCATLGRPAEEILGRTDADFFPAELADKYREDDRKVMQTRTPYETVEKHVTPDGQTHHVQVIKSPLVDADDAVSGTQCIFWDVTGKRRAEEELARSEERFALAVRGSNDGLFDWNIETGEIYYSPRFKELLGHADHELPNTVEMHFERIHDEDVERVRAMIRNHLKEKAPFDVEYRARVRSGEYLWFHARGQALWNADGRALRMAGSLSDIASRKMSEEQLREQNIRLHEMARSERKAHQELMQAQSRMVSTAKLAGLGEMVAGVAHEINNPLSFVSNNVCVLQRDLAEVTELIEFYRANESCIEESKPDALASIRQLWGRVDMEYTLGNLPGLLARTRDGLKRIQQIVKDLRVFARLDESDLNEVELNSGIESTVNIVSGHAKKKQVRIELDLKPLPLVTCYPAKINQVIMNLLSNAIDASHEGGIVRLRSGPDGGGVLLEVQDHGTGITPEVRERIFDPFFTTKPVGVGTGLGLSISYGIIADHGGTIELDSTPGLGTTFRIHLPRKTPSHARARAEGPGLASAHPI